MTLFGKAFDWEEAYGPLHKKILKSQIPLLKNQNLLLNNSANNNLTKNLNSNVNVEGGQNSNQSVEMEGLLSEGGDRDNNKDNT